MTTAKGKPVSARAERHSRVLGLLAIDPGREWRPADVAQVTGMTTHNAAKALYELWTADRVVRYYDAQSRRGTYQHKEEEQTA